MSHYDELQELICEILTSSYAFSFIVLTFIGIIWIISYIYKGFMSNYYNIKNHRYNYIKFMTEANIWEVDDKIERLPYIVSIRYGSGEFCALDYNGDVVRGKLGIRFNTIITDDYGNEIIVKTNTIGLVKKRIEKTIIFKVLKFILRKDEPK